MGFPLHGTSQFILEAPRRKSCGFHRRGRPLARRSKLQVLEEGHVGGRDSTRYDPVKKSAGKRARVLRLCTMFGNQCSLQGDKKSKARDGDRQQGGIKHKGSTSNSSVADPASILVSLPRSCWQRSNITYRRLGDGEEKLQLGPGTPRWHVVFCFVIFLWRCLIGRCVCRDRRRNFDDRQHARTQPCDGRAPCV